MNKRIMGKKKDYGEEGRIMEKKGNCGLNKRSVGLRIHYGKDRNHGGKKECWDRTENV